MYSFRGINHGTILTHAVLISLTPLIPVPFLDDWVKSGFQRSMVRQLAAARGRTLTGAEIELLLQDDFWDSCVGGCVYTLIYYPAKELLSKLFFILEWRRAVNLVSQMYYYGFLFDAALLGGFPLGSQNAAALPSPNPVTGSPAPTGSAPARPAAETLRVAIRRAKYGANMQLIQTIFKRSAKPGALFGAAWQVARDGLKRFPSVIAAAPGAVWRGVTGAPGALLRGIGSLPGRVRANFLLRIQVLLGRQKAPEILAVERVAQRMQAALLNMPSDHFDLLYEKLRAELAAQGVQIAPGPLPPAAARPSAPPPAGPPR